MFLSYGHDQYAVDAERIKTDLEHRGHTIWFYLERIRLGGDWEQYIEEGLKYCDRVVLLITPHSMRREKQGKNPVPAGYCLNEVAKAYERHLPIIPVVLVDLEDDLPPSVKDIPSRDFRPAIPVRDHEDIYPACFAELVQAIREEPRSSIPEPQIPHIEESGQQKEQRQETEKKFIIFLSYGRDEYTDNALRIKEDLESRGHLVIFDPDMVIGSPGFEQYVEDGLQKCNRVVLLMTPGSVSRKNRRDRGSPEGYCLTHIAKALEKSKEIIPVLLVELIDGVPTSICRIQYLDLMTVIPIDKYSDRYLPLFDRLADAIEQKQLNFKGGQAKLIKKLRLLDFRADVGQHIARFTGRKWIFDEIDRWMAEKPDSRVFWLLGGPGIGKSAVAAWLCNYHRDVIAFHLCIHGHTDKSDPRRAVLSIVYQITQHLPLYDAKIQGMDLETETEKDAYTLFDNFLVQPFTSGVIRPEGDKLVIIDAIDEATKDGKNEIARFIRDHWKKTPP
ncbi:MAG: toll/interleukin-1 receptor domain-containing protein [Methanospirillum hungatei]|nr:toll/interleukin-1 receptor domain-containing protein [Methanospirillum hungatei]